MTLDYLKTHPWLSFELDLRRASSQLWMLLGEARSKCDHVAGVPLPLTVAQELYLLYFVKGVKATTAIEGNLLSEEEIQAHLEGQLTLPESRQYQQQEVANVVRSCNAIASQITEMGPSDLLSRDLICRFNAQVLEDLPLEADVRPGVLRQHNVTVGRYLGAPPKDLAMLTERLCRWLNEDFAPIEGLGVGGALLKAVLAHLYIAWIHPFGDGNGRTARLVEFFLLVNAGVPAPSAHLLSNHYNLTRAEYYRQLDAASRSNDVMPFLTYAVQGFVEGLRQQLALIRDHQWALAWNDLVRETLAREPRSKAERCRALVDALTARSPEPVPRNEILLLDARIARLYARVSDKTFSRDLAEMEEEGLIAHERGGYRARMETILAFLPPTWPKPGTSRGKGAESSARPGKARTTE
jgi:Fic family protein